MKTKICPLGGSRVQKTTHMTGVLRNGKLFLFLKEIPKETTGTNFRGYILSNEIDLATLNFIYAHCYRNN